MASPRYDNEGLVRFRLHPATIPPMSPYWWKTESPRLRSQAAERRLTMSHGHRLLWAQLSKSQLGTKCLRGVVVSGNVVDFFIPEARLIIDSARGSASLGANLTWYAISPHRLIEDLAGVVAEIQAHVTERAGVVSYDPLRVYNVPALPPFGSARMQVMIAAATDQRRTT